jgi:hypothetical protein
MPITKGMDKLKYIHVEESYIIVKMTKLELFIIIHNKQIREVPHVEESYIIVKMTKLELFIIIHIKQIREVPKKLVQYYNLYDG